MAWHITDEEIKNLKAEYSEIYLTNLGEDDVIFRVLSVRECHVCMELAEKESAVDSEEYVINTAVVWPKSLDFDDYMIGEVTALSSEILEASGFADLEVCRRKIEEGRETTKELPAFMIAMIIASNQGYTADELEDMSFSELAKKSALAERIFALQSMVAVGQGESIILDAVEDIDAQPTEAQPMQAAPMTPEEYEALRRGEYRNPEKDSTIGAATAEDPIARKLREALGG